MKNLIPPIACALISCTALAHPNPVEIDQNKSAIRAAFEAWRSGTGGPFSLLAADAKWTITGNSVVAKTYQSREEFLELVIRPFNSRLARPLVPTVQSLHADGEMVIILFTGEAIAADGQPYRNSYAWFMRMKAGRIEEVTAFFDSIAFNEFWTRLQPRPS